LARAGFGRCREVRRFAWAHASRAALIEMAGNQYSIENELDKPARIYFSQGCETVPDADD